MARTVLPGQRDAAGPTAVASLGMIEAAADGELVGAAVPGGLDVHPVAPSISPTNTTHRAAAGRVALRTLAVVRANLIPDRQPPYQ